MSVYLVRFLCIIIPCLGYKLFLILGTCVMSFSDSIQNQSARLLPSHIVAESQQLWTALRMLGVYARKISEISEIRD